MLVSEKLLKWAIRLYPPLFFQRIWVQRFYKGFRGVEVKVHHSLLNKNYNSSIFGGTIFSATDPFYAILFDQILRRENFKTLIWLKRAEIQYIKPARTNLYFSIQITEQHIDTAKNDLENQGKHIASFHIKLFDKEGTLHATVQNEVYIRNLNFNKS